MLRAWAQQRVERVYHAWAGRRPHARPNGWLFQSLSATWRTSRSLYRRWQRSRQTLLLCLDEPARLTGLGSLTGWVLSREAEVVRVEAWVNGCCIAHTVPNHQRLDAKQAYPFYPARQTGYRLCPTPGLLPDGIYSLRIVARDSAGNTTEQTARLHIDRFTLADDSHATPELFGSDREYQHWLKEHDQHTLAICHEGPSFSIIVLRTPGNDARQSIERQTYPHWQVLECDATIESMNEALSRATGDLILLMTGQDQLHPQALHAIALAHQAHQADLYYTDEDVLHPLGYRCQPFFKPAWSPELFTTMPRLSRGVYFRRSLRLMTGLLDTKSLRPSNYLVRMHGYAEYSETMAPHRMTFNPDSLTYHALARWDLMLRLLEQPGCKASHVPGIFYHVAYDEPKDNTQHIGIDVLQHVLERQGKRDRVEAGRYPGTYRCRPNLDTPLVTILIPSKDQPRLLKRCINSIRERTDYAAYEIIVLDNGSVQPATLRYLAHCGADRVITVQEAFNHSSLNNLGAEAAQGEYLVLLNDDTEVLHPGWLKALLEQGQQPGIGAVGGWLLYPDGQTQHAGIMLDPNEIGFNINSDMLSDGLDRGLGSVVREVSAITGACLLVRRQLYLESGGLDAEHLPTSFNDIDFCLKLRRQGWRILHTPFARLIHHEAATRQVEQGKAEYRQIMIERWGTELHTERFWNQHLGRCSDWSRGLVFRFGCR